MALDHAVVKRLAFIKYLYQTSVSQSHAPSPLSCASLLTMHDAVELFLQLASEYLNVDAGKRPAFMDYWDILNTKLSPNELQQRESMRRLNKARVALKHHGTFPSELDIESFRASTTGFFKDNTQLVFSVALEDISLIEFVNPEAAREKLKEAQGQIQDGDILAALDNIALAFDEMVSDYEDRNRTEFHSSPFYFGMNMTSLSSFAMGLHSDPGTPDGKLGRFVDSVKDSIEGIQGAIKILALGIDYRKYSRFKVLTPHVHQLIGREPVIQRRFKEDEQPSEVDACFCIDFTIESALALAEFDYTLEY